MSYILIYVAFCWLVALLGKNRKMGFWGYLFCSLLLTPIVGLIMIFASDPREIRKVSTVAPDAAPVSGASDRAAKTYMTRIDGLVETGRITRDYASQELVPLLVRYAGRMASSGTDGQGACSLDTILKALEKLPARAAAPVPSAPSAAAPVQSALPAK